MKTICVILLAAYLGGQFVTNITSDKPLRGIVDGIMTVALGVLVSLF